MYENGQIRPVETILRRQGRRIKENDGGGEFLSTFVNVNDALPVQQ
jgi:hypothetical protein